MQLLLAGVAAGVGGVGRAETGNGNTLGHEGPQRIMKNCNGNFRDGNGNIFCPRRTRRTATAKPFGNEGPQRIKKNCNDNFRNGNGNFRYVNVKTFCPLWTVVDRNGSSNPFALAEQVRPL